MIEKIIRHGKLFFTFTVHFNIIIAIKLILMPLLRRNTPAYKRYASKHSVIKKYLKKKFRKTINSFNGKKYSVDSALAGNYPIWVLWWQGEDTMPPIIKTCHQTLKRYANGHQVNLITKGNFNNYVNLPGYILKRLEKKHISITHLADILRVSLLYEHGGLWLDSSVLLTAPLPSLPPICSHLGFWTPKDDGAILETCFEARNWIVRENKWLTFCFYVSRYNILMEFVRNLFFAYTKSYSLFIDYFLFDYFISICYETMQQARIMIDSVPVNNPQVHEIQHRLNLDFEYNKILFDDICSTTFIHKLDWKDEHREYTETGKLTNYGYIINNFPPK